jgi:hypothetical protein
MNVGSLTRLHGMKVFDQAVHLTHGMAGPYGWDAFIPVVVKASVTGLFDWLPPRCKNNCN